MEQKVRKAAENMVFTNIIYLSEDAMAEINFGISKAILAHLVKDIDDGSFYQYVHDMQLWVHRVNSDEVNFNTLVSFSDFTTLELYNTCLQQLIC